MKNLKINKNILLSTLLLSTISFGTAFTHNKIFTDNALLLKKTSDIQTLNDTIEAYQLVTIKSVIAWENSDGEKFLETTTFGNSINKNDTQRIESALTILTTLQDSEVSKLNRALFQDKTTVESQGYIITPTNSDNDIAMDNTIYDVDTPEREKLYKEVIKAEPSQGVLSSVGNFLWKNKGKIAVGAAAVGALAYYLYNQDEQIPTVITESDEYQNGTCRIEHENPGTLIVTGNCTTEDFKNEKDQYNDTHYGTSINPDAANWTNQNQAHTTSEPTVQNELFSLNRQGNVEVITDPNEIEAHNINVVKYSDPIDQGNGEWIRKANLTDEQQGIKDEAMKNWNKGQVNFNEFGNISKYADKIVKAPNGVCTFQEVYSEYADANVIIPNEGCGSQDDGQKVPIHMMNGIMGEATAQFINDLDLLKAILIEDTAATESGKSFLESLFA